MANNENKVYTSKIVNSSRELTPKERVMYKERGNANSIDALCDNGNTLTISPALFVELAVHNEKSKDNKDYNALILVDAEGNRYVTGSSSFMTAFFDIWDEMYDCDEEWGIVCYKLDSKNYKGKQFLTCSVV